MPLKPGISESSVNVLRHGLGNTMIGYILTTSRLLPCSDRSLVLLGSSEAFKIRSNQANKLPVHTVSSRGLTSRVDAVTFPRGYLRIRAAPFIWVLLLLFDCALARCNLALYAKHYYYQPWRR